MKKKLLSIILMVALVLAMVVSVVACQTKGVEEAAEAFRKQYITDSYDKVSYDLIGTYDFEGTTYTITWTANIDNVKFATSADGKTVTVTATRTAEAQPYTLTATLSDGEGNTKSVEFRGTVPANPNAGGQYGDPFYLYMDQENLAKIEWLKNTISSSIAAIETSDKKEDAIEYFFEPVSGQSGQKLFFLDGTTKKYVGTVPQTNSEYFNVTIAASTDTLWTVREDKILVTTIGEKQYFLGTNGTYFTATLKELDDLSKSFPVKQAGVDENIAPAATITASALNENCTVMFTDPAPVNGKVVTTIGATIKFTVTADTGCTIDSVKLGDKTVTATDGVYTATVEKTSSVRVETTNPNAREENLHASFNMPASRTSGDNEQSVFVVDNATITSIKGESKTNCVASPRFYKDSTLKIEYAGMLRVVLTMEKGYGAEGFEGMTVEGATIKADGTTAIIIFDQATDVFTSGKLAAQIRISKVEIYTGEAGGIVKPEPSHEGTEADPYTATDAKIVGDELENKGYTATEVYVKAYIVAADYEEYNSQYKNISFWLSDSPNGEKLIQVYRGTLANVNNIPYIGDLVLVKGYLTNYSGKIQFSTNTVNDVKFTPIVTVVEAANSTIKASQDNESGVTVTFTDPVAVDGVVTAKNGSEVKFTVAVNVGGKALASVRVNNVVVNPTDGVYTVTLNGNMEVLVELVADGQKNITITLNDATRNEFGWAASSGTGTKDVENLNTDVIKSEITRGSNNSGSWWSADSTWRFYQASSGCTLKLSGNNGNIILKLKITYSNSNSGTLLLGETAIASDQEVTVTNNTIAFTIGSTEGKTNGQVKITAITIVYESADSPAPSTNEAKIGSTEYATLAEAIAAAKAASGEVTITLLKDVTSGGIALWAADNANIVLDLNNHTLTLGKSPVGSIGTESQGLHLEKGNIVVIKNGTITSVKGSGIKMLINNYCTLTLDKVTLDGSNLDGTAKTYTVSNNFGTTLIKNGSVIKARSANDVALDVWYGMSASYEEGLTVTVEAGCSINGAIEYGAHSRITGTEWIEKAVLVLPEGEYTINYTCESVNNTNANITIGGTKIGEVANTETPNA